MDHKCAILVVAIECQYKLKNIIEAGIKYFLHNNGININIFFKKIFLEPLLKSSILMKSWQLKFFLFMGVYTG